MWFLFILEQTYLKAQLQMFFIFRHFDSLRFFFRLSFSLLLIPELTEYNMLKGHRHVGKSNEFSHCEFFF